MAFEPTHARSKRLRAFGLAAIAAGVAGAAAGVARWIEPPPAVSFFACWATHLRTPLVDDNLAAENDRDALAAGRYFPRDTFHLDAGLSAELLDGGDEDSAARVVYVSAFATRDDAGRVVLMTRDFHPLTASGGLPVAELLAQLCARETPTLLVLDLSCELTNGQHGLLPCGVGERLHELVNKTAHPNLLTLVSCSPGETATLIAGTGRSTFGYFFEAGLIGYADGYNRSAITDSRVSARELGAYVCSRVAAWTRRHGASPQLPRWFATGDTDFLLTVSHAGGRTPAIAAVAKEYPAWIRDAWLRRDAWLAGHGRRPLARLVKRYEIELLDAERRWRMGGDPTGLKTRFASNSRTILKEIEQAQELLDGRPIVSLAQRERTLGAPALALAEAWRGLLAAKQPAPAGDTPPAVPAPIVAFREAAAEAPPEALAAAGLAALLGAPRDFARRLELVAQQLPDVDAGPTPIEIDALVRLAKLQAEHPALDATLAREALRTTVLRERVWADPVTLPWIEGVLGEADRRRQTAWAMLMSPGFASPEDAQRFNATADALYRQAARRQEELRRAMGVRDRALRVLPALAPLVHAFPVMPDEWCEAARRATRLADLLTATESAAARGGDSDALSDITAAASQVDHLLTTLLAPVSEEATDALAAELGQGRREHADLAEALLSTPLLSATQRESLCQALGASVGALTAQLTTFAQDRSASTVRAAVSGAPSGTQHDASAAARGVARTLDEAHRSAAVLQLAGLDTRDLEACIVKARAKPGDEQLLGVLALLRATAAAAFAELREGASEAAAERACQVLPAGRFSSVLDKRVASPPLTAALARRKAWGRRMAARLMLEAADVGGSPALAEAARRLGGATAPPPVLVSGLSESPPVFAQLSEQSPRESLSLRLRGGAVAELETDVYRPDDLLEIRKQVRTAPEGCELQLTCRLKPDATFASQLTTRGVLLRLADADRVSHYRIPTPRLASVPPVAVRVEFTGASYPLTDQLTLPPTSQPQPMRLVVTNRTAERQELTAAVTAGGQYAGAVSLPPLGEAPLKLSPAVEIAPDAKQAQAVNEVCIVLRADTAGQPVLERTARLTVAEPADWLRVLQAGVVPNDAGAPAARLRLERLPGAPDPVTVGWSLGADPPVGVPLVTSGSLTAALTEAQPVATVHGALALPPGEGASLLAAARINGVARAMAWRGDAPAFGRGSLMAPCDAPEIQITAPAMVAAGGPLRYTIDAAPANAGLSLRAALCGVDLSHSEVIELSEVFEMARRHTVAVLPKPVKGDLLLHVTIGAQSGAFDTTGMTGRRMLAATVFDEHGVAIATSSVPVVIDGDAASVVRFAPPVDTATAGAPLKVSVEARDELSGIRKVRLYVGAPVDNLPPKGAVVVAAARDPDQPHLWSATAPMPKGVPSAYLTAEVTNGVGLVRCVTAPLTLISAEQASMGRVTGAVTEGDRPQPGVRVELRNPEQQPVAEAKTNRQGEFVFEPVKPGKYLVWSVKQQSQRVGAAAVEVKPGGTSRADVELSL